MQATPPPRTQAGGWSRCPCLFPISLLAIYSRQIILHAGLVMMFLLALPEGMGMMNTAVARPCCWRRTEGIRRPGGGCVHSVQPDRRHAGHRGAGLLLSSVLRNFSVSLAGLRLGLVDVIFLVSGGQLMVSGLCARIALRQTMVTSAPAAGKRSDQAAPGVAGGAA